MAIKIKDIARMANVSEATVSLALNGKEGVKEETKRKVIEIAREVGYTPSAYAQGLAKRISETIGLIVPDIENPYFGRLVRCIDKNVREYGYKLVIAISDENIEREKAIVKDFISKRVEGIIIAPLSGANQPKDYLDELNKNSIPCVFVTSYYPELDASCVMVDLEEGTYKLVQYLLDLGHRDIFFLAGAPQVIATEQRVRGYIKAFEEKGIDVDKSKLIECRKFDFDEAYNTTFSLVGTRKKNIDAIITMNDIMALGVLRALDEQNIKVPEDISLCGYDNVIFSSISLIPITTVNQDIDRMALAVTNILFDEMKNKERNKLRILIKPELVIRKSTISKR
ncbi:MAG TPA: LacI family DNA-binding transcriptional regulator [Clostridiaceae bacterium]